MSPSQEEFPETHPFICPWCEVPGLGLIRGTVTWDGYRKGEPPSTPVEYTLVECGECGDASLETRENHGQGFEADQPFLAYPPKRRLSKDVPKPLHREFDEAQKCFTIKAYGATVVMVRRILEGVCSENGIQERTLVKSLEELKNRGLIDDTISDWARALRILGNEGAHYTGRQVPREDAEDAITFAEALLDNIYVLRKRFTEFMNRRAGKNPSTTAP